MRFDNPIIDHGFTFPDIATFPDITHEKKCEQECYQDIELLKKAFKNKDTNVLDKIIEKYLGDKDPRLNKKLKGLWKFYLNFENSRKENDLPSNKIYEDLYKTGLSVINIDITELRSRAEPQIKKLLAKKDWRPPVGVMDRTWELDESFIEYLNKVFKEKGILQAATKYNKGGSLKVARGVLHVASPTDSYTEQFLYDCTTIPKTINMHIDPKENVMKAMIYLNDVQDENGAFKYIEKSNRWIHEDVQYIFAKAISTGSYCDTEEARSIVFSLPPYLRVSSTFGRLLMDDDPMQKMLLDQERTVTSNDGNTLIFDTAGIHNGGLCKKGNRYALQILMK